MQRSRPDLYNQAVGTPCPASKFKELVAAGVQGFCALNPERLEQLYKHYELMIRWNNSMNLTAIHGVADVVERHYCESLALGSALPEGSVSVLDIGSGAGFPGIPVAVLRPDCQVTLLEANQRKAVFLREATREFRNVSVVAGRFEAIEGSFDWAISRAVNPVTLLRTIVRSSRHVALLVAELGCSRSEGFDQITWRRRVELPWGERRYILIGDVAAPP